MSRISRVVVLVAALMSMCAVLSSSAGAVSTWKSTNTTAFTADGGPLSLSGNGKTLSCTGATATGAATALDFTGATWNNAIHINITLHVCILAGTPYAVTCTFTIHFQIIIGITIGGTGDLNAPNGCTATVGGVSACRVEGQAPASYDNPPDAKLTIPAASLTVTNGTGTTCPLITGTSGTGALTAQTFTITGANAPTISGT
jgi:hypothetical protein